MQFAIFVNIKYMTYMEYKQIWINLSVLKKYDSEWTPAFNYVFNIISGHVFF